MSLFVDPNAYDQISYTETIEGENGGIVEQVSHVWIRHKMGFGTRARLQNDLYKVSLGEDGINQAQISVGVELQKLLLLQYNIVKWDGPLFMQPKKNKLGNVVVKDDKTVFEPVKLSRHAIEQLDPDHPFIVEILEAIDNNNAAAELPPIEDNGDPVEDGDFLALPEKAAVNGT